MPDSDLDYCKIVGRIGLTVGDGPDAGENPDLIFPDPGATVTFEPLQKFAKADGAAPPITLGQANITCWVDPEGYLTYPEPEQNNDGTFTYGNRWVWLVDMGSGKVNPVIPRDKAAYRVTYKNVTFKGTGVAFPTFTFHPLPGVDNDLTLLAPVPVGGGQAIVVGPKGDEGRGIESTSVTEDGDLVVLYSDGDTENAGLLPEGPPGPPGPDTQTFYKTKIQPYSTNLILNPRINTAAAWSKTTGLTFDTTGVNGATMTDTNGNGNEFIYPLADNDCIAGQPYSEGAFFTLTSNPATSGAGGRCTFIFLNSSNAIISTVNGPVTTLTGAAKQRVTFTQTAPPGATKVRALFYAVNMTGGATVRVQQAMLVAGATLPEYFDGSTALGDWTGVADNSTSIQLFPAAKEYNALRDLPAKVTTPPVSLVKVGSSHAIATQLGTSELVVLTSKSTSNNGSFDIDPGTTLGGAPIWQGANTGDDITPLQMPSGFIGGDHGFARLASFANPDAKSTNELGSVWTDGTREYVLAQILPNGRLVMMGSYTKTNGVTMWETVSPTVNLTFVSSGLTVTKTAPIVATSKDGTQMWPSTMKQLTDYRNDGKSITADGTYAGVEITTRETYDVMAYDSVYDLMKANPGVPYTQLPVAAQVRVNNKFRWLAGGLCLVSGSIDELVPVTLQPTGGIQSFPPFVTGGTRTRYLFGVGLVGGYDWTAGVDVTVDKGNPTVNITAADAPLGAPLSLDVIKLNGVVQFGWAVGYLPYGNRGDETSRSSARFTSPSDIIWQMNTSTKIYPYYAQRAPGWGHLKFDGFRAFLTPEQVASVLAAKSSASAAWSAFDACKNVSRTSQ